MDSRLGCYLDHFHSSATENLVPLLLPANPKGKLDKQEGEPDRKHQSNYGVDDGHHWIWIWRLNKHAAKQILCFC